MSNRYRATVNVSAANATDVMAAVVSAVDTHCPVHTYNATEHRAGLVGIVSVSVTFDAANDAEAHQIMRDAGRATGRPFDSVSVFRAGSRVLDPA